MTEQPIVRVLTKSVERLLHSVCLSSSSSSPPEETLTAMLDVLNLPLLYADVAAMEADLALALAAVQTQGEKNFQCIRGHLVWCVGRVLGTRLLQAGVGEKQRLCAESLARLKRAVDPKSPVNKTIQLLLLLQTAGRPEEAVGFMDKLLGLMHELRSWWPDERELQALQTAADSLVQEARWKQVIRAVISKHRDGLSASDARNLLTAQGIIPPPSKLKMKTADFFRVWSVAPRPLSVVEVAVIKEFVTKGWLEAGEVYAHLDKHYSRISSAIKDLLLLKTFSGALSNSATEKLKTAAAADNSPFRDIAISGFHVAAVHTHGTSAEVFSAFVACFARLAIFPEQLSQAAADEVQRLANFFGLRIHDTAEARNSVQTAAEMAAVHLGLSADKTARLANQIFHLMPKITSITKPVVPAAVPAAVPVAAMAGAAPVVAEPTPVPRIPSSLLESFVNEEGGEALVKALAALLQAGKKNLAEAARKLPKKVRPSAVKDERGFEAFLQVLVMRSLSLGGQSKEAVDRIVADLKRGLK